MLWVDFSTDVKKGNLAWSYNKGSMQPLKMKNFSRYCCDFIIYTKAVYMIEQQILIL